MNERKPGSGKMTALPSEEGPVEGSMRKLNDIEDAPPDAGPIDIGTDVRTIPPRDVVAEFRALADFFESRPVLAEAMSRQPYSTFINIEATDKADFVRLGKQLGTCEKGTCGDLFYLRKTFGQTHLDINCQQNLTCERVKVGTKTIPAQEEKTVDVYEWKCPESILKMGEPEPAAEQS